MTASVHDERPVPLPARFLTPGTWVLLILALLGGAVYAFRLLFGLGAVTNLTTAYPWGIWIAVDVASGVALAAGGFTTAFLVEIAGQHRYHRLLRPALLTAMLGYTFVVIGLLADLGRYYNVWHPMMPDMWQGNSVLFEVGMCVMAYLTVLYAEFMPMVVERFKGRVALPGLLRVLNRPLEGVLWLADRFLRRFLVLLILAGVVLSCLHQSSLGTLMLIAPLKMHPLWYTPISPLLFLLSAIAVGFPMVIFESMLAARSFRLPRETELLASLARFTPILLGVYLVVKVVDLTLREAWGYLLALSPEAVMYLVEGVGGVALPLVLLSIPRLRRSERWLFRSATLVIAGVVLNRLNVFLVAYRPTFAARPYFPSPWEILLTVGLISTLVLVYRFCVMVFPVVTAEARMAEAPAPTAPGLVPEMEAELP
jgi:Ni/Fe-hydrogenase subunit HybB-like protein